MPRLQALDPPSAPAGSQEILAGVKSALGMVPNMFRTMAASPAVLAAYHGLSSAAGKSSFSVKTREKLALAIGEANRCGYCVAAHTLIGGKYGVTASQAIEARRGLSDDPREAAAIGFALALVKKQGNVSDKDIDEARRAGLADGDLGELVAITIQNVFTNWFNHMAGTEIDMPAVPDLNG